MKEINDKNGLGIFRFDLLEDTRKKKGNPNKYLVLLGYTGNGSVLFVAKNGSTKYVDYYIVEKHFEIIKSNSEIFIRN